MNELKKSNATDTATAEKNEISILYAKLEYQKAANAEYAQSKQAIEDYLLIQQLELASLKQGSEEWYNLSASIENTKNTLENFGKKSEEDILNDQLAAIELSEKSLDLDFAQGKITEIDYNTKILEQEQAKLALLKEGTMEWYNQSLAVEQYKKKLDESGEKVYTLEEQLQGWGSVGIAALNGISNALNEVANEQDTTTREGFEKQKKLSIAAATMQMIQGIATAVSGAWTTKSGPWDFVLMAIQAASILASGIMQINKIKKMTFENSSASAGGGASVSSGAVSTLVAPVQYTQDIQGQSIEESIKNTRVYVTESDITNTQRRVSVSEDENRY